jgi:hypothetical protein
MEIAAKTIDTIGKKMYPHTSVYVGELEGFCISLLINKIRKERARETKL